ncbi:nicotinate-nicotinamide nucleotide adenylyltransferase [Psychromonas sp. MME1]
MGMDSLQSFDSWYQWQEILNYCHLVISERPGTTQLFNKTIQALVERCRCDDIATLHNLPCGKIYFQTTSQFDISSTQIRQLLKNKMPIDYLLPEAVHQYIKQQGLYQRD